MATGLWVAATLMLACHFWSGWVRAGYGGKVLPPAKAAQSLPMQLGDWRAVENIPLDKGTANVLGAGDSVSRVYRNAAGDTASIHVAVWTDFRDGPTGLHYPDVCYPSAGWQILGTETARVEAREVQRTFWGERELPFVAKVLVQISASDVDSAKPRLEELASEISAWTKQLRRSPATGEARGTAGRNPMTRTRGA
jgi:hypothetical protein